MKDGGGEDACTETLTLVPKFSETFSLGHTSRDCSLDKDFFKWIFEEEPPFLAQVALRSLCLISGVYFAYQATKRFRRIFSKQPAPSPKILPLSSSQPGALSSKRNPTLPSSVERLPLTRRPAPPSSFQTPLISCDTTQQEQKKHQVETPWKAVACTIASLAFFYLSI